MVKRKTKRARGVPILIRPRGAGSDAVILVPNTGTLKIDADTLTVGANTVYRPRDRIAGAGALELVDVKDATPTADLYGMVVLIHPDSAPLAVTGAFYQATQPVSLAVAIDVSDRDVRLLGRAKILDSAGAVIDPATKGQLPAALTGSGNLKVSLQEDGGAVIGVDDNAGSLTVDGTFWQATQPVSLAAAVDVSDRAARLVGVIYGSQAQQLKQTATNFNQVCEIAVGATLIDPRSIRALTVADVVGLGAGTAQIGLVKISDGTDTALITTAGRQQVQPNYDGQVPVMFTVEALAGIIAETIITITRSVNLAATGTGTSFGPTAGKNLRLWGMIVSWISTSTTANTVRVRLRAVASGTSVIGSPLQASFRVGWESATFIANEGECQPIHFPNAIEIPNGGSFSLTLACVAANGTLDISLFGDEYTP